MKTRNERLTKIVENLKKEKLIETDAEFCKIINLDQAYYSRMKYGRANVTDKTIDKVKRFFPNIDVNYLKHGDTLNTKRYYKLTTEQKQLKSIIDGWRYEIERISFRMVKTIEYSVNDKTKEGGIVIRPALLSDRNYLIDKTEALLLKLKDYSTEDISYLTEDYEEQLFGVKYSNICGMYALISVINVLRKSLKLQ